MTAAASAGSAYRLHGRSSPPTSRERLDVNRETTTGRAALGAQACSGRRLHGRHGSRVTPAHASEEFAPYWPFRCFAKTTCSASSRSGGAKCVPFPTSRSGCSRPLPIKAAIAIENLRMFDEIQQKSRALELAEPGEVALLAAASHDLRQPMHALSLFVGQLSASRNVRRTRRADAAGRGGGRSLTELLDQLLDLSRLEAGAVQVVEEEFAVQDLARHARNEVRAAGAKQGIELRVMPSSAWVRTDPVLAEDPAESGGQRDPLHEHGGVLVGCRGAATGCALRCGIPAAASRTIGAMTCSTSSCNSARLELPRREAPAEGWAGARIVARLVDLLGTHIELRSSVGRGSMFAFELPLGACRARQYRRPESLRIAGLRRHVRVGDRRR